MAGHAQRHGISGNKGRGFEFTGTVRGVLSPGPGRTIYVHTEGGQSGSGAGWDSPLSTMAAAFAVVQSGDTILVAGNVREQLVTPTGIFDVRVVGVGPRPRHADAHTDGNGRRAAATWRAPASPTATTALCRVLQQGWVFENILFAAHTDYGALEFVRNAGADDAERDASHGAVLNCRFAGGAYGILIGKSGSFTENVHNLLIAGNTFNDQTTAAISGINGRRLQVLDNVFMDVASGVIVPAVQSVFRGNTVGKHTTYGLDLNGGEYNMVNGNWLSGAYTTDTGRYRPGTSDDWSGNFSSDEDESTVTSGITHAVPTTD